LPHYFVKKILKIRLEDISYLVTVFLCTLFFLMITQGAYQTHIANQSVLDVVEVKAHVQVRGGVVVDGQDVF